MFNDFLVLFRRYCNMSQASVAEAARIPLKRYRTYETGKSEPTEDEYKRIARVFGLDEDIFKWGAIPIKKTISMFEPMYDDNLFDTPEDRERAKILINMLKPDELHLLMLYRTSNSYYKHKLMLLAEESAGDFDTVTEDFIDETISTTMADIAIKLQKEAGREEYEKFKNFVSDENNEKIRKEIKELISRAFKTIICEVVSEEDFKD